MISKRNHSESRIRLPETSTMVRHKAELLCLGIKVSPELSDLDGCFVEHDFIHGSQIFLGDNQLVNVAVNEHFVFRHSPFELMRFSDRWFIARNGVTLMECKPLLMPPWTRTLLNHSVSVGDIVRPHSGSILFCAPIKKCVFERLNRKCKFCTFADYSSARSINLDLIGKAFQIAFSESEKYNEVAIGGATPNLQDHGLRLYSEIVETIKQIRPSVEVSVEMVPPRNLGRLADLQASGVDSIIMNIEIFDDECRRAICPGKSAVPKAHYFDAWKKCVAIFGRNRVSSVLLVGLEDRRSTVEGVRALLKADVLPTLIPFRPYDACELRSLPPVPPEYYLSVYEELFWELMQAGVDPLGQPGCSRCGGCSLETVLVKG